MSDLGLGTQVEDDVHFVLNQDAIENRDVLERSVDPSHAALVPTPDEFRLRVIVPNERHHPPDDFLLRAIVPTGRHPPPPGVEKLAYEPRADDPARAGDEYRPVGKR